MSRSYIDVLLSDYHFNDIRKRANAKKILGNGNRIKIYDTILHNPGIDVDRLCATLQFNRKTIESDLQLLEKRDLLIKDENRLYPGFYRS